MMVGVEEYLQGGGARAQAEDRLQGVVRVGEGNEAAQGLHDACRVLIAEEAGDVDKGEQDGRRVQQHVGGGGGEVGDEDADAVRRDERREDGQGGRERPDQGDGVQQVDDQERGEQLHQVQHGVDGEHLEDDPVRRKRR
jgi:hypothetical protein